MRWSDERKNTLQKSAIIMVDRVVAGRVYGRWTVLKSVPNERTNLSWSCKCECGKTATVNGCHLAAGKSKSCGCLRADQATKRLTTHGDTGSRLYQIHANMKKRCSNKTSTGYHNYGGRGISVCAEWKDYDSFREWALSSGYTDKLMIDRKDNDGNYEPINCRWVTSSIQNSNRRKRARASSMYLGVHSYYGKYRAVVTNNGVRNHIGTFSNQYDAAIARDMFIVSNGLPHKLNKLEIL